MDDPKLCPLLSASGKIAPKEIPCRREKCEWWDSDDLGCAIRTLAASLFLATRDL